jgi:putative membrane protein
MTQFIKKILLNVFACYLVSKIIPQVIIPGSVFRLIELGAVIVGLNWLLKPVVKLLLLPLNFLSLGLFSWVPNVLVIYLTTQIVPEFSVSAFTLSAINYSGFAVPALSVSLLPAFILTALAQTLIYHLLDRTLCS